MYNEIFFFRVKKTNQKKTEVMTHNKEKNKNKLKSSGLWILTSLVSCLCSLSEESWILSSLGLFASVKSLKKMVDWKQGQGTKEKKNKVCLCNKLTWAFFLLGPTPKGLMLLLCSGDWLMCLSE
jgi:hypothetical protein